MSSNFQYSAANSSKITKRSLGTSPIKKIQRDMKKLLPSQSRYMQNLKKAQNDATENSNNAVSELTVLDYNVELDYQLSSKENFMIAIDTILNNMWSESNKFHRRYDFAVEGDSTDLRNMEQAIFMINGLSLNAKSQIMKFRSKFPNNLVTVNQLYSIYSFQGHTFVDKRLELEARKGNIKKFIITNAAPVISRSSPKKKGQNVTYGHENVEVVVKTANYMESISKDIARFENSTSEENHIKLDLSNKKNSLKKFKNYLSSNPTSLFLSTEEFNPGELSSLVMMGYLTLTSNHLNEIESHQYSIAYPNCGTFLKLINSGRTWLVKTLSKSRFNEILEDQLFEVWDGQTQNNESKMSNFRSPFFGYDLNWILADASGSGIVEVFNTPVGRGWKLTGKV